MVYWKFLWCIRPLQAIWAYNQGIRVLAVNAKLRLQLPVFPVVLTPRTHMTSAQFYEISHGFLLENESELHINTLSKTAQRAVFAISASTARRLP